MPTYTVTFDRIGRNKDPQPLVAECKNMGDLMKRILKHARPNLASREVYVGIDSEEQTGHIYCGVRVGSRFKFEVTN